jgi:energy-coupling factor transporter ATP-binding protein EcfA2
MNNFKQTVITLNQLPGCSHLSNEIELIKFEKNPFSLKPMECFIVPDELFTSLAEQIYFRQANITTDGIHLVGPTGCGKSTPVRQLLALLNYPVQSVTGHGDLEFCQTIGRPDLVDGMMGHTDGPLKLAYEHGHAFLFEEREKAPARTNVAMNSILDGAPLHVEDIGDGFRCDRKNGFLFISTGNAAGGNDFSGGYTTAEVQDISCEDRFDVIEVDYVSKQVEMSMICKPFGNDGLSPDFQKMAGRIVDAANICRSINVESTRTRHNDAPNTQLTLPITYRGTARMLRNYLQMRSRFLEGTALIDNMLSRSLNLKAVMPEERAAILEIFRKQLSATN